MTSWFLQCLSRHQFWSPSLDISYGLYIFDLVWIVSAHAEYLLSNCKPLCVLKKVTPHFLHYLVGRFYVFINKVIYQHSLIYSTNNKGPKTLPCGIPLRTLAQFDVLPLTVTCLSRTLRKF